MRDRNPRRHDVQSDCVNGAYLCHVECDPQSATGARVTPYTCLKIRYDGSSESACTQARNYLEFISRNPSTGLPSFLPSTQSIQREPQLRRYPATFDLRRALPNIPPNELPELEIYPTTGYTLAPEAALITQRSQNQAGCQNGVVKFDAAHLRMLEPDPVGSFKRCLPLYHLNTTFFAQGHQSVSQGLYIIAKRRFCPVGPYSELTRIEDEYGTIAQDFSRSAHWLRKNCKSTLDRSDRERVETR